MSKAFTKEDAGDDELVVPPRAPLPAGVPNYVTARGLARLRDELRSVEERRARLEATSGDAEGRDRRLSVMAARVGDLTARIGSAQLVEPGAQPGGEARFGATVTVRPANPRGGGSNRRYTIVGVDEADAAEGRLAFVSPMARALLGHRVGDIIEVRTARADEELEIVSIAYPEVS